MRWCIHALLFLFFLALPTLKQPQTAEASDATPPKPKVKLAVLLVFDQLRGDYPERWQAQFGEGGFKRLQNEGAWYTDCHYPYAGTYTGPGHASLLTGCAPNIHGIINNEWYDRKAGESASCVQQARYKIVPPKPASTETPTPKSTTPTVAKAGAPDLLLSDTVADQLKAAKKGKVFGLSLKDRSAILPTGKKPDGAYWFDGRFVTSTYYADTVHPWVAEFNKAKSVDRFFGKNWERFKPDLDYDKLAGPDEQAGESKGIGQGVKFPHPTDGGKKVLGKEYYESLANSPFGNDILLDLAKVCIDQEKLGQSDTTDLLTLSFSSNDIIGHAWGPDSHEVLDMTLRTDALIEELLKYLDAKIGKGNYCVVLTADHGICPLPEVSVKRGVEAKRISPVKLLLGAERHLRAKFVPEEKHEVLPAPRLVVEKEDPMSKEGKDGEPTLKKDPTRWIEAISGSHLYLNHKLIRAKGQEVEAVAETLARYLETQEGVQKVYTAKELASKNDNDDPLREQVRLSTYPGRSGDLFMVLKPYHLPISGTGTTHGSPHSYDTHVPLMVFGPGIRSGISKVKVTPMHAAPILSHFLGLQPPKDCLYPVPEKLLK
jgi:predicted AlkP superfamily pyrophosphatase or phosphodiesterase